MNPFAKYVAAGLLTASSAVTGLHYVSHGWLRAETKILDFVAIQENHLVERLLARLAPVSAGSTSQEGLEPLVTLKAKAAGLPPELVKALVDVESSWKVDAIRFEPKLMKGTTDEARMLASSHGLLQVLGSWAKSGTCPGVRSWSDLYDPAKNITCGIQILAQAKQQTGSTRKALLAYNGGMTCAARSCPAAESHANKVLNNFAERIAQ